MNMVTVTINVGGSVFEIPSESLKAFPDTRLGQLSPSSPEYNTGSKQYFFNRNPEVFNSVLDLYRTGSLHLPTHLCGATLRIELEFWKIPITVLSQCCIKTYFKYENDMEKIEEINNEFKPRITSYTDEECHNSRWKRFSRHVWLFMDQPSSSLPAKIFALIFMVIVALSVIITAMETLPQFRKIIYTDEEIEHLRNTSNLPEMYYLINLDNPKLKLNINTFPISGIYYAEIFIYFFFSLEFIIHFAFCPHKIEFFYNFLNVLDAFLCVCMWIVFIIYHVLDYKSIMENTVTAIVFTVFAHITGLRLLKIFRFLKIFPGLHLLCMSIKWNLKDLCLLIASFMAIACVFGILIFLSEFTEPTTFPNIFIGMWWASITMTTVGYGDHYPKSFAGSIVGICCAICGLFVLALPVALLTSNFNDYYKRNNDRERFLTFKSRAVSSKSDNAA